MVTRSHEPLTMSREVGARRPGANDLQTFIALVERELGRELGGAGVLEQAARPLVLSPLAKRARPMVVFLLGRAVGAELAKLVDIAVAVELVHAASLLHDDVVDGASERRGIPTANARFGAQLAVLAGDLLLTAALSRLRRLGGRAVERAVEVVAEMTRGVATELAARKRLDLTGEAWRAMAEAKTGALFGVAGWLAASSVGEDERATRFDAALRHLGVAFQIADDAGDFAPDQGETPYLDLRDGNPSYPVLLAARTSPELRARLTAVWAEPRPALEELAALAEEVAASGALAEAADEVRAEIERARFALRPELGERRSAEVVQLIAWADALATSLEARYLPSANRAPRC